MTSWFSVNMGTGIVSILLYNLPYNWDWLYWLSVVVFAWNSFLFCTFLCISIVRYSLYPEIWFAMIRHPSASMFLGTVPMALATIVEMIALVCVPAWGPWAANLVCLKRNVKLQNITTNKIRLGPFGGSTALLLWPSATAFLLSCEYPFVK